MARTNALWNPVVDWAERDLGARMVLAEGVMPVEQEAQAMAAIAAAVPAGPALLVAATHVLTTLTGSALLALAVVHGALDFETAWTSANADEDWNWSLWGADEEALAGRLAREADARIAALVVAELTGRGRRCPGMIVSHRHRFIFLKTKKTASSSVELALSEICGPDDIITPLIPADEKLRRGRGPQNYAIPVLRRPLLAPIKRMMGATPARAGLEFYNHMPAHRAKAALPRAVWGGLRKGGGGAEPVGPRGVAVLLGNAPAT